MSIPFDRMFIAGGWSLVLLLPMAVPTALAGITESTYDLRLS